MIAQHASFYVRAADGPTIARALHAELVARGWTTTAFDSWPVASWTIACARDGRTLELDFAQANRGSWTLVIAPAYVPGLLGRLRGRSPSARPDDCYELARAVHRFLRADRRVSALRWRWDRPAGAPWAISEPPTPPPPEARLVGRR